MGIFGADPSEEGEYFEYKKSVRIISEVLIAVSTLTAFCSVGALVGLGIQLQKLDESFAYFDEDRSHKDVTFALFIFTIVILIVSISDIVFALILRIGIQKLQISYCLFWRGATVTSLVIVGMLTLAFITMVRDLIVVLGYFPSLVSKPLSLWIVNAFISELGELRSYQHETFPPKKPSFSLDDMESLKRSTTVFYNNNKKSAKKYSQKPYAIQNTLRSIQE